MSKKTVTSRPKKRRAANQRSRAALVRSTGRVWALYAQPRQLARFIEKVRDCGSVRRYILGCEICPIGLVERLYFDLLGPPLDASVTYGRVSRFWSELFATEAPLINDPKMAIAFVEGILTIWEESQSQR